MSDTTTLTTDAPAAEPAAETVAPAVDVADDGGTALGGAPVASDPEAPAVEDTAPEAPVIPERYELTLPEGMALDTALLDEATPIFKEIGLTNDTANKLMPFAAKLVENTKTAIENELVDRGAAQRKAWLDEAKAAEDIGGSKWDATLSVAARGLDALGYKDDSAFRQLLNDSGLGNHPDMIRIAAKLGELAGESGFARSDAGAPADVLSEMYPNNRRSK